MKIAFLADPLDTQYAGIHVFCKELLKAISKQNSTHEMTVITASENYSFAGMQTKAFPIHQRIPLHARMRQLVSIPRYLNSQSYDLVVELAHFGPFRLKPSIKRVTFLHDLTPISHPQFHNRGSSLAHKLLLPSILQKADAILCNSHQTQKDIQIHYPEHKDKVKVVHLGKSDFYHASSDPPGLENLGINQEYFLHVGTLEPRKNIPFLIDAYHAYRQQFPDRSVQLVLAGKWGWSCQKIEQKLANSPFRQDIIVTGYVSEDTLRTLYSGAQGLICSSHYEGFGLPVVEAMACGAPVLLSGEGSLLEVGGEAGNYFDTRDVDSLVELLTLASQSNEWRLSAKQRSLQRADFFSWEKAAAKFISILEKLVISS